MLVLTLEFQFSMVLCCNIYQTTSCPRLILSHVSMQPLDSHTSKYVCMCVYIYILTNYCCIVSPGFKSHEDIAGSVLKPADVGAAVHEES